MSRDFIDLRSDTVTKPTPGMAAAMSKAELGDDVYGEDPSVNALQERLAHELGKEAALFVPSGTMSNQIGVRLHCGPAEELICEESCHIYNYEQGAFAALSGVVARTVPGEFGVMKLEQLRNLVRPDNEHLVVTRAIAIENTHNRGGGKVQPFEEVKRISEWARGQGLGMHLDGARLYNAVVATGIEARQWAKLFDTVSVCFSKGLGAPIGSALAGPKALIAKARRHRKLFGGAMRQVGVIASAALYALENHVDRLAEDHANAKLFAEGIASIPGVELWPKQVDTNLIIFRLDPSLGHGSEFSARLKARGVLINGFHADMLRAVTHLDVSKAQVERAVDIMKEVAKESRQKPPAGKVVGAYG